MRRQLISALGRLWRRQPGRNRRRRGSGPVLVSVLVIGTFGVMRLFREADAPLPPPGAELSCAVAGIHDGDTLTARCDAGRITVRVFGIDAPEMGQEPWGAYSRDLLSRMLPAGKVGLQVTDIDRYGRIVARVMDGDRDLGLSLVRQGGAVVYERYNRSEDYQRAQTDAERERAGVWSEPGAHQTPWQWRRLNPRS